MNISFSLFNWAPISFPPYAANIFISLPSFNFIASSVIWMASSLVGVKISPCILLLSIDIFSNRGSKNAKVLPVPVWAWAITSQPFL